jgi:outer membrane murein-binding lipoprotein Lpp
MTTSVQVIMQAQKEFPADMSSCRDKFLVQALSLSPGEEFGPETFRAGVATKDTKIRVVLEGPPAPPSPVPEVNETEEDSSMLVGGALGAAAGLAGARAAGAGGDSGLSQENRVLRAQVERLMAERDQMRRQLDAAGRGGKGGVAVRGGGGGALSPAMLLVVLILAAMAFLAGHYAQELIPGGLPLPPLSKLRR